MYPTPCGSRCCVLIVGQRHTRGQEGAAAAVRRAAVLPRYKQPHEQPHKEVPQAGEMSAEATIGRPVSGRTGVLWWISAARP